jgi:hypothetical protein
VLLELTASCRRLALVGLAKNTGKTEVLAALLRELRATDRRIGVTSVGRDGEEHDVIDFRIEKPRIELVGGSLVATTDELLRSSGIPHDLLEETDVRTPLGRVLIARLRGGGAIEVAGPSSSQQMRKVSDAMLRYGAEQVLIDGAIDRRAASSSRVADGLVIATGAVLSPDIREVVAQTKDAVELARLPTLDTESETGRRMAELFSGARESTGMLVDEQGEAVSLPPGFVLSAAPPLISALLNANPGASWLLIAGALPDRFLRDLLEITRQRRSALNILVADPTRVFLADRGVGWYERQGIHLVALRTVELRAITVNPLAPKSHRFDSRQLRGLIGESIPGVPVLDVLSPD